MVFDRLNDIITGRAPFSAYDQLVSDWRSQGGDAARKEFQDAVQKAKG
jgi:putative aldouronate transport system substrate-binding protein